MKLVLERIFKGETYTIGKLYVDGEYFCDTLEDKVRNLPATCPNTPKGLDCKCKEKVKGKTAIPAGTYRISYELSPRFKRKLPRLLDVPHFIGILIHRGNTDADTEGCILVGENKVKGKVINSTPYEKELCELMETTKEDITIIIK